MKMTRSVLWTLAILFTQMSLLNAQQDETSLRVKTGKEFVDFLRGNELVTRYHIAPGAAMGFAKPIFWPVHAPGNIPLTRSWPMEKAQPGEATDHPHQKSAWFCHGDVIPEGIALESKIKGVEGVDFWSEAKGHGLIVCTSVAALPEASGRASIVTKNEWRTAEGVKIMDEQRRVHLYDLGKARLIVVVCDLHASVSAITFGDTKEGAFGIRINDKIHAGKKGLGKIQNAEGKIGEKECWGQISPWCDYSGPIDGKLAGLTLFADPKNTYPSCWHVRGYGLMAANPFGREQHARFPAVKGNNLLVRLDKGQHLRLRYGMLLHLGDAVSGQVAQHYQRFIELREKD